MIYSRTLVIVLLITSGCSINSDILRYVDPFIGTDATHFVSEWRSEACTYPGAVAPHGIVQVSPETSAPGDWLRGYYYSHDTIRRFSMAEHFSGWPDGSHGKGIIMPFSMADTSEIDLNGAASSFSHDREQASPGYYSVYLENSRINCTFMSLTRSAIGKFEYQPGDHSGVIISGIRKLVPVSDRELEIQIGQGSGYIGKSDNALYLLITCKEPFILSTQDRQHILTFPHLLEESEVKFKIGASYTSRENARLNLNDEIPGWDMDETRRKAESLWIEVLERVEIVKGLEKDKTMFYTALYHGALLPVNATDVNGQYPGYEDNPPLKPGETHYIYYTPWDAFRTLYPMINFLYPEKGRDFMRSLIRIYNSSGRLPEPEVMTGVHISVLVADALARGINDFDAAAAFRGLSELILEPPYFRADMEFYDSLGYVPFPHQYATTATLEFAFNDWAFSRVAYRAGEDEIAEMLLERSLNYRNNYRPETRFMESKKYDGSWSYAPVYAEADRWNMSWFVPHDTRGLINLMGGDEAFSEHLDKNFRERHFVLDNECPMNFPFLFTYAGKPWKTMEWKNKTLRYFFNESPGGIPGNDDWGSMSAWYAWGALGFFPVCPGTEELVISGPVFEKVILHLPEGKRLVIESDNVSEENIYVQECFVDGLVHNQGFIRQSDLLRAGNITFSMSDRPGFEWGLEGPAPYSVTVDEPDFEILELRGSSDEVSSNEEFFISAAIENSGATGSYPLFVAAGDKVIYSAYPLIGEGSIREIEIPLRLYSAGPVQLELGEKSVAVNVKAVTLPPEEAFEFSAPEVEAFIRQGDSIFFRCRVKNISGGEAQLVPEVYLDDSRVKKLESLELGPGEEAELAGSLPPVEKTGFYRISVQGGTAALFKVYLKPEETLALHYTFDEGDDGGTFITDHSGFGNHGQIAGSLKYVEGIDGKGILVQEGYVDIPGSRSLQMEDEQLTMICWYRPGPKRGTHSLITKGGHNMLKISGGWQLQLAIGGWGVGKCMYNVPADPVTGGPSWSGKWSHFSGTRADDRLKLYYNGKRVDMHDVTGTIGHTGFRWCVGTNAELPIGRTPDGVIDEVMIFAEALTEDNIRAIYESKVRAKNP